MYRTNINIIIEIQVLLNSFFAKKLNRGGSSSDYISNIHRLQLVSGHTHRSVGYT
jgi:hypothetical protein